MSARTLNFSWHTTIDQAKVDEFKALLSCKGLHDVSHWTLPNGDVPFNENVALAEFIDGLDAAFDANTDAINSVGAPKK